MFRFDLSPVSEPSCRSMPVQHDYEVIKYPSILTARSWQSMPNRQREEEGEEQQKQLKQSNYDMIEDLNGNIQKEKRTNISSPARTASTQFSSNCSMNNTSTDLEFSPDRSDAQVTRTSSLPTDTIKIQCSPETETDKGEDTSSDGDERWKGRKRSNSFSKIFKSLHRNISLVNSVSFDSGIPKISKRFRKKKNLRFSATDVDVRVVEGEGVEVTTKYSDESIYSDSSSYTDRDEIFVPKIVRRSSTFGTGSLTYGEESEDTGIDEDQDKIQRICNLMSKVMNSRDDDDIKLDDSNSEFLGLEKNVNNEAIEVMSVSSVSEGTKAEDFADFMIFVNNEQTVLEYAPEEFQRLE